MTASAMLNLSIPVTPRPSPASKGRAEPQVFNEPPAPVGLSPTNSPLSTYRGVPAPVVPHYSGAGKEQRSPGALCLFRVKEGII